MLETFKEFYAFSVTDSLAASTGAGTVGRFQSTILRIEENSDFLLEKMIYQATSRSIILRMRDSRGRYINPQNVDLRAVAGGNIAGNSHNAFELPVPYRFANSSNIEVELADYSGSTNEVRLALLGSKVRCGIAPWHMKSRFQTVIHSTERVLVAANGTSYLTIVIDSDADFIIHKTMAVRTGAALVSVNEGGRDLDWVSSATHIDNMFGDAMFPHVLSEPRFVYRNSTITFTIQDLTGNPNTVEIILVGVKAYDN